MTTTPAHALGAFIDFEEPFAASFYQLFGARPPAQTLERADSCASDAEKNRLVEQARTALELLQTYTPAMRQPVFEEKARAGGRYHHEVYLNLERHFSSLEALSKFIVNVIAKCEPISFPDMANWMMRAMIDNPTFNPPYCAKGLCPQMLSACEPLDLSYAAGITAHSPWIFTRYGLLNRQSIGDTTLLTYGKCVHSDSHSSAHKAVIYKGDTGENRLLNLGDALFITPELIAFMCQRPEYSKISPRIEKMVNAYHAGARAREDLQHAR
ncbi:MAG: hypothetical protein AB7G80_08605 [Dongiaceae bacterium]